jgi:O-antigen ligase
MERNLELSIFNKLRVIRTETSTGKIIAVIGILVGLMVLARFFVAAPQTMFLAIIGIVLLAISLLSPNLGLLIWAGFLSIQIETYSFLGVNIAPSDVILFAIFLGLTLRFAFRRITVPKTQTGVWMFGLMILFTFGVIQTFNRFGYLPKYTIFNKYIGLLILIVSFVTVVTIVNTEKRLFQLIKSLFWTGVTINYLTLGVYLLFITGVIPTPLQRLVPIIVEGGRLRGFLLDPNAYGGFVFLLLILQLACFKQSAKDGGYLRQPLAVSILNTFALLAGLFFTFSRSAWLGFAIGVFVLLKSFRFSFRTLLICVLGIVLAGWVTSVLPVLNLDPQFFIFRNFTFTQRLNLIDEGWRLFSQSPIFGIGLGTFHEVAPTIIHNSYIWLLVEMGPLALFLLLGIFFTAVKNCNDVRHQFKNFPSKAISYEQLVIGIYASLFAFYGLALGIEALYQRHLWLLIAFSEIIRRLTLNARPLMPEASSMEPI